MVADRVRLYVDSRYLSPYALTAYVAAHEKRLDVELVTVDLAAKAQHDAAYSQLSLTARVPTLVHDGFALSESTAIAEYLDDSIPGPALYPREHRLKARARQLQAWLRSDLMPIRQERSTEVVFRAPSDRPLSPEASAAAQRLFAAIGAVLPAGAQYLFGHWSIADVDVALMLNRLVLNGDPVPERLLAYAQHQWARPTVQQWVHLAKAVG